MSIKNVVARFWVSLGAAILDYRINRPRKDICIESEEILQNPLGLRTSFIILRMPYSSKTKRNRKASGLFFVNV